MFHGMTTVTALHWSQNRSSSFSVTVSCNLVRIFAVLLLCVVLWKLTQSAYIYSVLLPCCMFCRHVDSLHTAYVFPQECGGRVGVHWLHLATGTSHNHGPSASATPKLVVGTGNGVPFQFSLSPHSLEQIAGACHQHELPPNSGYYHLHFDAAHMGLGGDDSWSPTVHTQYIVEPRSYLFQCCIQASH
jgi:hypothetical protein